MEFIQIALQIVIALGIFNVWFLRGGKTTQYRGKGAGNIEEEFAAYGLSKFAFYAVGTAKVACAVVLLIGIWFSVLVTPAASILALLMVGAIAMHLKVNDPAKKSLPAVTMLGMCLLVIIL